MDIRVQVATVLIGLLIWGLVAIALKKSALYPSYASLWMILGGLLLFLPIYANILHWLSGNVFGIIGTNHLIYAMLFAFLLIYLFYLTQKLCQLTNRVERVIVALAILESQPSTKTDGKDSEPHVEVA